MKSVFQKITKKFEKVGESPFSRKSTNGMATFYFESETTTNTLLNGPPTIFILTPQEAGLALKLVKCLKNAAKIRHSSTLNANPASCEFSMNMIDGALNCVLVVVSNSKIKSDASLVDLLENGLSKIFRIFCNFLKNRFHRRGASASDF